MKKPSKIPLLNFEAFIENELLLEAEKLFDEGKLSELIPVKNGVWQGTVSDKKAEHIVVRVFNEFIEQSECTCKKGNKDGLCIHLICGYFGIRNSDAPPPPKEVSVKRSRKKRSSALNNLLKLTDKEELADYISSYASKDRRFNLLLKTHFARKFSEVLGQEIYSQIMDSAFPAVSEVNTQSLSKNQQFLVAITRELLIHYKDAISLEQYTDAFFMIYALLQKIAYALQLKENIYKPLADLEIEAHEQFSFLLNDKVAPALRERIIAAMLEIIDKTYYQYTGNYNLYTLTLSNITSIEHLNAFKLILQNKFEQNTQFNLRVKLLAHYIKLCHLTNEDLSLNTWLNKQLADQFILLETIESLLANNYYDETTFVLDALQRLHIIDDKSYYKLLLKLHLKLNNKEEVIANSLLLFELTNDLQYAKTIREFTGDKWSSFYENIIQELMLRETDSAFISALNLTAKENDLANLFKLLQGKNELDLYMKFDKYLIPTYKEELCNYYEQYLLEFHKDHAGPKAVDRTFFILDHLESTNMHKESAKIRKSVLNEFPERKSLQTNFK